MHTTEQQTSELVLQGTKLRKEYAGKAVVEEMTISLKRGEVLGLLGPNGAGKTTTFGMLYGAIIPTAGNVRILEFDLFSQGGLARGKMGIVPQDNNLDLDFTVFQNLVQYGRYCGSSSYDARINAQNIIERLGLSEWSGQRPNRLSGGLVRRVMLARALLLDPAVVFLDEPTTGLDPDVRQDFWRLVLELKNKGKAVLLTTHYMDEASRLCDRLMLLQNGKIVHQGNPQEIVKNVVGDEVIEITGGSIDSIRTYIGDQVNWMAPFSDGVIAMLSSSEPRGLLQRVMEMHPTRFVRRAANLEDVFLKLTGAAFEKNE